jgi:hypothetical protein
MPAPGQPTPQGVSDSLDALGQQPGAIAIRTASGWSILEPGPLGYVLTSNGPFELPTWQPPS